MAKPIVPCLWFDDNVEEAVNYYLSVFDNSRIVQIDRYSDAGPDNAEVVVIDFEINGQPFQAFNGGPAFSFSEATSFVIDCADQDEVDYYWDTFTAEGEPLACGWLKDRYGVSWQIIPRALNDLLRDPDRKHAGQVMQCMLQMDKIVIADLEAAYNQ